MEKTLMFTKLCLVLDLGGLQDLKSLPGES